MYCDPNIAIRSEQSAHPQIYKYLVCFHFPNILNYCVVKKHERHSYIQNDKFNQNPHLLWRRTLLIFVHYFTCLTHYIRRITRRKLVQFDLDEYYVQLFSFVAVHSSRRFEFGGSHAHHPNTDAHNFKKHRANIHRVAVQTRNSQKRSGICSTTCPLNR